MGVLDLHEVLAQVVPECACQDGRGPVRRDYTRYAWRVWRESPTLYIPTFYSDAALLAGVTLMMLYTAWHLMRHILTLKNGTVA